MITTPIFWIARLKNICYDGLAVAVFCAFMALRISAHAADPDLSILEKDSVVKKPILKRGILTESTAAPKTTPTRGYDAKRGVVTIEEVDGTVKELPYVVLPLLFKVNSDELVDTQAEENLRKVAAKLQEPNLRGAKFTVEGHTSTEGARGHNHDLSKRRADRIFNLLVRKFGVEPSRLSAKGFGPDAPEVSPEVTKEDRQRNRRVLIVKESNAQ